MFEIIKAGGLLMVPILFCSVAGLAIVIQRFYALRASRVSPEGALQAVYRQYKTGKLSGEYINALRERSPLEQILAAALQNKDQSREIIKMAVEEEGRQVVHSLEYLLGALGTIAAISPLLGLMGTVIGMIDVFTAMATEGTSNAIILAGGISKALVTTVAGLSVAIPAIIFHHILEARVDQLSLDMEAKAIQMVDVLSQSDN